MVLYIGDVALVILYSLALTSCFSFACLPFLSLKIHAFAAIFRDLSVSALILSVFALILSVFALILSVALHVFVLVWHVFSVTLHSFSAILHTLVLNPRMFALPL